MALRPSVAGPWPRSLLPWPRPGLKAWQRATLTGFDFPAQGRAAHPGNRGRVRVPYPAGVAHGKAFPVIEPTDSAFGADPTGTSDSSVGIQKALNIPAMFEGTRFWIQNNLSPLPS